MPPSRTRRIKNHVLEQVKRERVNDFKRKADQALGLKNLVQQVRAEYEMHTERKVRRFCKGMALFAELHTSLQVFKEGFEIINPTEVQMAEDRCKILQDLVAQVFFEEDTDPDEESSGEDGNEESSGDE